MIGYYFDWDTVKNVLVTIFSFLFVILAVFGFIKLKEEKESTCVDKKCMVERNKIINHYVIALDVSNPLSQSSKDMVTNLFRDIADHMKQNDRLTLLLVCYGKGSVVKIATDIVKTKKSVDGFVDRLTNSPTVVATVYNDLFTAPLQKFDQVFSETKRSNTSPIIESLDSVFRFVHTNFSKKTKVWVVSDMIQNSSNLSFFSKKKLHTSKYKLLKHYVIARLQGKAAGLEIKFIRIRHRSWRKSHAKFWTQIVAILKSNRRLVSAEPFLITN